jgi:glycerol-3-phosphate dehydrogenase
LNALDAQAHGASILTRTECVSAKSDQTSGGWVATLHNSRDGSLQKLNARVIINAAGPWAKSCLFDVIKGLSAPLMRLVRGSHIVVPKLFDHDNAYIFQNPDRRIVFAIPYEQNFTMVGTTDEDFDGDLNSVAASTQEIVYLCETANRFFAQHITPDDIVWSFSGVRPLLEDGSGNAEKVTRDYRLDLQKTKDGALALSILGGKITTYRKLAEQAVSKLSSIFDTENKAWTSTAALPGGDLPDADIDKFREVTAHKFPWLPHYLLCRYVTSYGTRMSLLLDGVTCLTDLGPELAPSLFECEVRYLVTYEWAHTAEDILWRRTKLGILADTTAVASLQNWLTSNTESQYYDKQHTIG